MTEDKSDSAPISAADKFFKDTIQDVVATISESLEEMPAAGIFHEFYVKNLWEEYCLAARGNFLNGSNEVSFLVRGAVETVFDEVIPNAIQNALDGLPDHSRKFLEGWVVEVSGSKMIGTDVPPAALLQHEIRNRIEEQALLFNAEEIVRKPAINEGSAIQGSGVVWSTIAERGHLAGILDSFSEEFQPDGDVHSISLALLEAFLTEAEVDAVDTVFSDLLHEYKDELSEFLLNHDIIPSVTEMLNKLQDEEAIS